MEKFKSSKPLKEPNATIYICFETVVHMLSLFQVTYCPYSLPPTHQVIFDRTTSDCFLSSFFFLFPFFFLSSILLFFLSSGQAGERFPPLVSCTATSLTIIITIARRQNTDTADPTYTSEG